MGRMGGGDGPAMEPRRREGLRNDRDERDPLGTNVFYLIWMANLGGHIAPIPIDD